MEREREQGSDRLDTEERKELNDSDFGLPEERKYPMPDATHVRAAESYFRYATDQQKPELAQKFLAQPPSHRLVIKFQTNVSQYYTSDH